MIAINTIEHIALLSGITKISVNNMQTLNWGIIGPGSIAHDFARDLELVHPGQNVVAVLGRTADTMAEFCQEFNIEHSFTDLLAFIAHPGIDIVYIATPHPQHFEQASACLRKGIHVLCEKPMTLNAEQSAQLISLSEQNNCFLMEAMWIRFLPSIEKVLLLIKDQTIGRVLSVKAFMGYKAPKNTDNRYFNPALGGGSLLDLGIYPVFLAQLLLGNPTAIKALGTLSSKGIDETCAVLLQYPDGSHAMMESSLLAQAPAAAEITGEKGIIRILNPWFEKSIGVELHLYDKEKIIYPCEWEGHGLQFEINEVLRCLMNKQIESDLYPHAFSREVSETLDEIRRQIGVTYKEYE